MNFAAFLREHWPRYVRRAGGRLPAAHWRAAEAALSCRTPRRGGHVHVCPDCRKTSWRFHSCNHRNCPQCGASDQKKWAASQQARLLPVPYFLVTVTVPEALRLFFLRHPAELCGQFLQQSAHAFMELCAHPKHLGGRPGFIAVLQTWTRQMLHHPHLHLLVPAVALAPGECALVHPAGEAFLVPITPLGRRIRNRLRAALRTRHPDLLAAIPPAVWRQDWVVNVQPAGRGKTALRYLAGYVRRSAFHQDRLTGYDDQGRVLLRWKDSRENRWKTLALDPLELIRRWLLHVLPRGFVAVRHYGWLSPAAKAAFRRVRFLLGRGPVHAPVFPDCTPPCPCCGKPMVLLAQLRPVRGPPLSRALLLAPPSS